MMLVALILVAAVAGFWLGLMLRRPGAPTFVREVSGSPPRWSVDHLAQQVATVAAKFEPRHEMKAVEAVRSARVRFVSHRFRADSPDVPYASGLPASVSYRGRVVITEGDGWERRLAWALMQRVRIELHGEPAMPADIANLPQFAAADRAAQEVADGIVPRRAGQNREVGAVVADR